MIQMLINLGKWLEQRFPKKVHVTVSDWTTVVEFVAKYKDIETRLQLVETNAVHKEPVKLLVEEMAKLKAELASLRTGLGITASANSPESMEAMLNGAFIQGDSNGSK
jgi:hypothetical protein